MISFEHQKLILSLIFCNDTFENRRKDIAIGKERNAGKYEQYRLYDFF